MNYYTVCPDCGYKLLKAGDGSTIEIHCPKCGANKSIGLLKIMRNVLLYMNAMVYQESCPSLYKNGIRDTDLVYLSLGNGGHIFN